MVNTYLTPWVEKHRPRLIDHLIQQDIIKREFNKIKETGDMPHLLLHGPPGTGKTSSILALVMELFGPVRLKERVLELNASDERGIGVVRNKIIHFAKVKIGTADPLYPSPNFKIIILDEADAMTNDAQSALRKVMESTTRVTRFVFICNYDHQIIDSIKSRCSAFRFKQISPENCSLKLRSVANKEQLKINDDALNTISDISQGDVRRAINILQNLQYVDRDKIDKKRVHEITSYVDEKFIKKVWKLSLHSTVEKIYKEVMEIINQGYPIFYVLTAISIKNMKCTELTDVQKAKMNIYLSHCERRILGRSNELIQLTSLFCYLNGLKNYNMNPTVSTF
jgi:replication factor C subunit 2/4